MNFNRIAGERGTLLVQTLVMTVILSFLATMMLKWSFGRHTVATKVRRSIEARTYINSCMAQKAAEWGTNAPTQGASSCVFTDVPGAKDQTITVNVTVSGNGVTYNLDYGGF
ncbi:MAG: hypothetical protein PHP45_05460 [Elusimicrobiales bacterium]|nr:hypothetical protein [Elusimicrobiales bacterium]